VIKSDTFLKSFAAYVFEDFDVINLQRRIFGVPGGVPQFAPLPKVPQGVLGAQVPGSRVRLVFEAFREESSADGHVQHEEKLSVEGRQVLAVFPNVSATRVFVETADCPKTSGGRSHAADYFVVDGESDRISGPLHAEQMKVV